jgi:cytoskeleton protein RodZ
MAVSQLTRPAATPETPSDAAELGALLREAREALKRELPDISEELRIKLAYLQAIEDGRLGDLPGPAYAVGFLRGYANFLGLDGEDIVNRFKAVGAVRGDRTELHLPSPVTDGRLPSGFVLLVGAVLAVCAYGAWFYASGADKEGEDKVAVVPPRIAESAGTVQARPAPERSMPEAPPAAAVPPLEQVPARVEPVEPASQTAPSAPAAAVATTRPATDAKPVAPVPPVPSRNGADVRPTPNSGAGSTTSPAAPMTPRPGAEAKPPQPTPQAASRAPSTPGAVPASVPPAPEPTRPAREAMAPTTGTMIAVRDADALGPAAQSAIASRGAPAGSPPGAAAPAANADTGSAATPMQGGSLPWLAPPDGPSVAPDATASTPGIRTSDRLGAGHAAEARDRPQAAGTRAEPAVRPERSGAVPPRPAEAASPGPPAGDASPVSGASGARSSLVAAERHGTTAEADPSGSITTLQPSDGQVAMNRPGEAARRILIEAKVDTWVEVRRGGGSPAFSRLMRAGETFEVPPQPGYRLSTGNAAGIEVSIDGQRLAPLGKSGAVRRNVVLDADALLRTPGVAP